MVSYAFIKIKRKFVRTGRTAIQNDFMFIVRYEQKREWKPLTNITENSSAFIGGEMNQLIT